MSSSKNPVSLNDQEAFFQRVCQNSKIYVCAFYAVFTLLLLS